MRKKIAIVLLSAMLLVFLLTLISGDGIASVVRGYTEPVFPAAWQQTIVRGAEKVPLKLTVNGVLAGCPDEEAFLTKENQVMLPISWIRSAFPVLILEAPDRLRFFYGTGSAEILPEKDEFLKDGQTHSCYGEIRILNGTVFLSAGLVSETLGIEYAFDAETAQVRFTADAEKARLPESFSLAGTGRLPAVQDQGELGACVAFASLSALESVLLPGKEYYFSRDHMLLSESFGSQDNGGEPSRALAYLLSHEGPVTGEDDPYGDGKTSEGRTPPVYVTDVLQMEHPDTETLKEAVFRYGGVEATMYLKMADRDDLSSYADAYDEKKAAYCCTEMKDVNHDVVIVGWDDAYSRDNFPCKDVLKKDGAFLCLNSWGKEFGDGGLFYVSYEDASFAPYAMAYTGVTEALRTDRIYQTDLLGPTASAGYDSTDAWFANVYTAEAQEVLTGAGFYTLGAHSDYELYIVRDYEDTESFSGRQLLKSGRIDTAGFHTVKPGKEIRLKKGERFAVLVHLNTEGVSFPVAVEKAEEGEWLAPPYRGYLGIDGSDFRSSEESGSCRVCLKAYTRIY